MFRQHAADHVFVDVDAKGTRDLLGDAGTANTGITAFEFDDRVNELLRWQSWRTFLRNHADAIAAIDLCEVRTLTFERLFLFLVIGHGRRQLLWFAITRHPTAEWLAQQIVEAFPWDM